MVIAQTLTVHFGQEIVYELLDNKQIFCDIVKVVVGTKDTLLKCDAIFNCLEHVLGMHIAIHDHLAKAFGVVNFLHQVFVGHCYIANILKPYKPS